MESNPDVRAMQQVDVERSFAAQRQELPQRHTNCGCLWIASAYPQFDQLSKLARIETLNRGAQSGGSERKLFACDALRQHGHAVFKNRDTLEPKDRACSR